MVEIADKIGVRETEAPVEVDELGKKLLKARDIIRTNGWCQNAYMDFDDPADWLKMKNQPRVCLVGALNVVFGGHGPEDTEALVPFTEIKKRMGVGYENGGELYNWNDATDRTQQEVEDALERAAYNL